MFCRLRRLRQQASRRRAGQKRFDEESLYKYDRILMPIAGGIRFAVGLAGDSRRKHRVKGCLKT